MSGVKSSDPAIAENGDKRNCDNDRDGKREPVYVKGHFRDGKYIKSQYRALPKKK